MVRRFVLLLAVAVCYAAGPVAARAETLPATVNHLLDDLEIDVQVADDARVRVGEDLRLGWGTRTEGDVVVINANVRLSAGARVDGNVVAIGGNVRLSGGARVEENIVAVDGDVHLSGGSRADEDVIAVGGRVYQTGGSKVGERVREPLMTDDTSARLGEAIEAIGESTASGTHTPGPAPDGTVVRSRTEQRDIASFGEAVQIPPDLRLVGDVAVFGGTLDLAGTVDGDVVVAGGLVRLYTTGEVTGDMATFGTAVERDIPLSEFGEVAQDGTTSSHRPPWRRHGPHYTPGEMGRHMAFLNLVVIGSFGIVVLLFNLLLEPVLERADVELEQGYVRCALVGLILEVAIPPLVIFLAITIVLVPIALLIILAAALGATVAMSLVSRQVGRRVMGGPGHDGTLVRTLVGYAVLASLVTLGQLLFLFDGSPIAAWTFTTIGYTVLVGAMTFGLGAVSLAQFGRWGRPSNAAPLTAAGE